MSLDRRIRQKIHLLHHTFIQARWFVSRHSSHPCDSVCQKCSGSNDRTAMTHYPKFYLQKKVQMWTIMKNALCTKMYKIKNKGKMRHTPLMLIVLLSMEIAAASSCFVIMPREGHPLYSAVSERSGAERESSFQSVALPITSTGVLLADPVMTPAVLKASFNIQKTAPAVYLPIPIVAAEPLPTPTLPAGNQSSSFETIDNFNMPQGQVGVASVQVEATELSGSSEPDIEHHTLSVSYRLRAGETTRESLERWCDDSEGWQCYWKADFWFKVGQDKTIQASSLSDAVRQFIELYRRAERKLCAREFSNQVIVIGEIKSKGKQTCVY